MPSSLSGRANGYGASGLLITICTAISWFIVNDRPCSGGDFKNIQAFHIIALIVGITLLVLGVLNLAGKINSIVILLYAATLGIAAAGGLMLYAAYLDFKSPCKFTFSDNIFKAEDGHMIAVFILDIISGLLLLSASGTFYKGL